MAGPTNDGYRPNMIEPRCSVCKHDMRPLVDKLAVMGYRPTAIARNIQDIAPEISRKSIERHIKKHLDLEQGALREILERRANEAKVLADEARSKVVTRHAVLDAMIERAWTQISDPNQRIHFKDALAAIEIQTHMEQEESRKIADAARRQLDAIATAVKEIVAPEQWNEIAIRARELYESPLLELDDSVAA